MRKLKIATVFVTVTVDAIRRQQLTLTWSLNGVTNGDKESDTPPHPISTIAGVLPVAIHDLLVLSISLPHSIKHSAWVSNTLNGEYSPSTGSIPPGKPSWQWWPCNVFYLCCLRELSPFIRLILIIQSAMARRGSIPSPSALYLPSFPSRHTKNSKFRNTYMTLLSWNAHNRTNHQYH